MVSTRGLKPKFVEGERVLCYEPDPTKAKVLYDSKVLDVVFNKDQKGKKSLEYLIHFQGWNSSWDRCVSEEFVLKDTPENRQLQWDLAEKSQLQLGAYLYRKDRKKPKKTNEGTAAQSSEDGSSGSPTRMDTDEGQASSSSEDESSTDGEYIPIEITPKLKDLLKTDYYKIANDNLLHKLPCEPNVVNILEMYFKHFTNLQMCNNSEKSGSRHRNNQPPKPTLADIHKTLLACREFLDGVRIYFDNYVNDLLLYKEEKNQNLFPTSQAVYPSVTAMNSTLQDDKPITDQNKKPETEAENGVQRSKSAEHDNNVGTSRKKSLRSYANLENQQITNGTTSSAEAVASTNNGNKPCSSIASSNSVEITAVPAQPNAISWKALPDFVSSQRPLPPCLVYGATHLTRLMVKIPEILAASAISQEKLKGLMEHLDLFIEYLSDQGEWFGDAFYRVA